MSNNRKQQMNNTEKAAVTNVIFPLLLLLLLFFGLAKSAKSQIKYVNPVAIGSGDGLRWYDAYTNLQDAIEAAAVGDSIFVVQGIYKPNAYPIGTTDGTSTRDYAFTLKNGVKLFGGFGGIDTTFGTRNFVNHPTILSGDIGIVGNASDNCYHVVLGDYINSSAILDGFTIRDGNANTNSITTHTPSGHILPSHSGGGMFLNFASPTVANCVITNNDALYAGGGVVAQGRSDETFLNCVFANNQVLSSIFGGAGLYNYAHPSNPSFPVVTNCIFYNNISLGAGGAIYTQYSNMTITNCTIYNNTAQLWGGGIYNEDSSNMIIKNCIIWGNTGNAVSHPAGSDAGLTWNTIEPNVRYSLLQTPSTYSSNINTNPMFVNAADPDGLDNKWATNDDGLILQVGSSCINAGTNVGSPATDIIGNARPIGGTTDMGAYEVSLSTLTITAIAGAGGSISPSGVITVAYGSDAHYSIIPNVGYCIADVMVDGISVVRPSIVSFNNIIASHTISATFTPTIAPRVSISSTRNSVCLGSSQYITATPTNGGTAPMYNFYVDGVAQGNTIIPTFNTALLSVGLHSIYCKMIPNNICQTSDTTTSNTININVGNITVLPSIGGATSACLLGVGSRLLNATVGGVWSSGNTSVATINSSTGIAMGVAAGVSPITYTYTNSFGCVTTTSTNFTVAPIGSLSQIAGLSSVCVGGSINLSNATTGGVWSSIAGRATISASGVVVGISAGTAQIRYTISNSIGCSAFVGMNVTVNANPSVPSIAYAAGTVNPQRGAGGGNNYCSNRTFTVVGFPAGGVWSTTGVLTVNTSGVVNTGSVTGAGTLTYTNIINGCSNSRTIAGNIVGCSPRQTNGNNVSSTMANDIMVDNIVLYPNPARSMVSLQISKLVGEGQIIITDLYGKKVKAQSLSLGKNDIETNKLCKGLYLVSIVTNQNIQTQKLVIE